MSLTHTMDLYPAHLAAAPPRGRAGWELLVHAVLAYVRDPADRAQVRDLATSPRGAPDLLRVLRKYERGIRDHLGARSLGTIALAEDLWDEHGPGRPPHGLLDLGCGSGQKTARLARRLGCPRRTVVGYEVRGYPSSPVEGVVLREYDGYSLPELEDGSQDLVTLFMVLHHVPDPLRLLREVRRVLSPGGRVLVKEHDCRGAAVGAFLDGYHWVVHSLLDQRMVMARYRSQSGWRRVLEEAGFEKLGGTGVVDPDLRSYVDAFEAVG